MYSPILLNETLKHHFESNWIRSMFEKFILKKLLSFSLYTDDLATYFSIEKLAFSFYEKKIQERLASGGFDLCKWFKNSR